jgi:hypothetical protein
MQEQQAAATQLRLNAEAAAAAAPQEAEEGAAGKGQRAAAVLALSCSMQNATGASKQLNVTLLESEGAARVSHAGHTFMTDATFTPDSVSWRVGNIQTSISRFDLSLVFDSPKLKDTGTCSLAERKF